MPSFVGCLYVHVGQWPIIAIEPEPTFAHAAQVVAGKDNAAEQDTSQSADNSITNANVAGRRLLAHSA